MTLNSKYNEYLKMKLAEINTLIEKELINIANEEYRSLIDFFVIDNIEIEDTEKSEVYVSYAFFLFSCGEYEGFLDMIFNAQKYGYSVSEIENILFEGFIEPNIEEYQSNYSYNLNNLKANNLIDELLLNFKELPFYLVPTGEYGGFYLYNKNKQILENKFSYITEGSANLNVKEDGLFSDYVIDIEGNLGEVFLKLNSTKKNNYLIIKDMGLLLSSLQGRKFEVNFFEKLNIFLSYDQFKNHFYNSDFYLPRNIIYDKSSEYIEEILNFMHNERLNKKSNRNNILLSICIPSYNRGHRAMQNIKRLLESRYDNEIEVVVSNNGSVNDSKRYYSEINEIQDSRLIYYEFEENQGFALNTCKVCELANGQYILLISDEDAINFEVLDKIMYELRLSEGKISIYRTSTTYQSKVHLGEYVGGIHALRAYMLSSNYMSGIILNNNLMKKLEAIKYIRNGLENAVCFAYPHMYWELLLLQYGTVKGTNQVLILEGVAESMEAEMLTQNREMNIPYYSTLESRLNQHRCFYEIFCDLEIPKKDGNIFREIYIRLCMKTLFLVGLSINAFYKNINNVDVKEMLKNTYEYCIDTKFLNGSRQERKRDIEVIQNYYSGLIKNL